MRTTWWLLGVSSIALLATSAVWSSGAHGSPRASSRRDPVSAHASLRHSTPEPLAVTPAPATTVEPPAVAPRPVTTRAARPRATPPVAILVEDEPPPPSTPLLWDELFPRSTKQSPGDPQVMTPCFDQLQGVEGLSPCPAATPRR